MLASDFDRLKKDEIEKRRLLRLQQVRQQSKLISKQSIERVQREAQRQNELIRRRKEQEMKLWREQNVEKLQKIYKNCLEEIGQGQRGAKEYHAEEHDESKKREMQQVKAAQRGREAAERLERKRLMKPKKKFVNKLKQKSVSIQTENNRLHDIGLKLDHADGDLSSSSVEMIDEPHVNFKESISKTILSSDDDTEKVKILSDITSEENKSKRQHETNEPAEDGYDQLISDYKSVYGRAQHPLHRPFSQLSDLVRGRTEGEIRKPSVRFDDYSSSYKLIDNVRSVTDKERLATLLDNQTSPQKVPQPLSPLKRPPTIAPAPKSPAQRPKFAAPRDNPIRIPGQSRTIPLVQSVAKLKADEELERQKQQKYQPPLTKRLPAGSSKSKVPTTKVRADYEALEKELAVLTKQISSGHNAYNFSVEKLAKDSRTRQNKMEAAFLRAANRQAPVRVFNNQPRQTLNVAQAPEKVVIESSPEESAEHDVEDEQLRRLQVLLGRINEQKQEVQQAMNESRIELEKKRKVLKPTTTNENDLLNHNNLLQSLLAHRQQTLEIEARELRLSQMEEKIEKLIRECSLRYSRSKRTRVPVVEVVGAESTTTSAIESSTDASTVDQLPKKLIINLGDFLKKKKKLTKHSSPKKEVKKIEKGAQIPDSTQVSETKDEVKDSKLPAVQQPSIGTQTNLDRTSNTSQSPSTSMDKSKDLDKYLNQISAEKEALEKLDVSTKKSTKVKVKTKPKPESSKPLEAYIKCLLKLSKKEVDELSVSSVSSVSTPNISVLETPGNRLRAGDAGSDSISNPDPTELNLAEIENFLVNNLADLSSNASQSDQLGVLTNLVASVLRKFLLDLTKRIVPSSLTRTPSAGTVDSVPSRQPSPTPVVSERSSPPQGTKVCTCGSATRRPSQCICGAHSDSSSPLRKTKINIDDLINDIETLRKSSQSEEILEKYTQLAKVCRKYAEDLNVNLDRKRAKKEMALEASGQSGDGDAEASRYFESHASALEEGLQQLQIEKTRDEINDEEEFEEIQQEVAIRLESDSKSGPSKSKDSGIESRPDTSSDVRGSADLDSQLSPQSQPNFVPLLQFAFQNNLTNSPPKRVEKLSERKKPPVAIERFSNRDLEDAKPHDLSTINEVESKFLPEETQLISSNESESVLVVEERNDERSEETSPEDKIAPDAETLTASDFSFSSLFVDDLKKHESKLMEYLENGSPFNLSTTKTASESQATSTSTTPSHKSFFNALEKAAKETDNFKINEFLNESPQDVSQDWMNDSKQNSVSVRNRPSERISEQYSQAFNDTSTHSSFRRMLDTDNVDDDLRIRTFLLEPPSEHGSLQVSGIIEAMNNLNTSKSKVVEVESPSMFEIDRISGILPFPQSTSSDTDEPVQASSSQKDSGKDSTSSLSQLEDAVKVSVVPIIKTTDNCKVPEKKSDNLWVDSVERRDFPSTFFHDAARCLTYEDTQSFELFKTQALEVARSKGCEELSEDLLMWFFVKEVVKPLPQELETLASQVENNLKSLAMEERAGSAVSSTPTSGSSGERAPFRIPSSIGTIELSQTSSSAKDSPARQPISLPPPLPTEKMVDQLPKYTGTIPKVRKTGLKSAELKTRPKNTFMTPQLQNVKDVESKQTAPSNSTPTNEFRIHTLSPVKPTSLDTENLPATFTISPYQGVRKGSPQNPNVPETGDQTKSFFTLAGTESMHNPTSVPTLINSQLTVPGLTEKNSTKSSSSLGVLPDDVDTNLMNTLFGMDTVTIQNFRPEELEAYLRLQNLTPELSPSGSGSEDNSTEVKRHEKAKETKRKDGFSLKDFIESEIRSSESSDSERFDDMVIYIASTSTSARKTRASTPRGDANLNAVDNLLSFDSNLSTISGISKHINEQKKTVDNKLKGPSVKNTANYASSTHSST